MLLKQIDKTNRYPDRATANLSTEISSISQLTGKHEDISAYIAFDLAS